MYKYQVMFTEEAARVRDALPDDRRKLLLRGVDKLADDPYVTASRPVGGEDMRAVAVAPGLVADYFVHRTYVVVVILSVLDEPLIND